MQGRWYVRHSDEYLVNQTEDLQIDIDEYYPFLEMKKTKEYLICIFVPYWYTKIKEIC